MVLLRLGVLLRLELSMGEPQGGGGGNNSALPVVGSLRKRPLETDCVSLSSKFNR